MIKIFLSILFWLFSALCGYFVYYFSLQNQYAYTITFLCFIFVFVAIAMVFMFLYFNRNATQKMESLKTRLKLWTNISYHVTQAGDEVFNHLPIGVLVYDNAREIKWANEYSKQIFGSSLVDSSLDSISKDLDSAVVAGKDGMLLSYGEYSYDVIHNTQNSILYFFDVTKREQMTKRYNARVTAIGVIGLDNLEESLKRYDVLEKNNIRGQLLGEISDWLENYNCYLQTMSNDRMVIVMDRESLDKMISDKFSVLTKVREISSKNRLKTSVSMGIACYDVESDELGSLAQNAIELAEKRGGDQVVVNVQGEKIQYFGGNTNSLEKNTLVEARMQTMAIKEAVESSSNVLIMCHNLADCDALGSMLGVYHLVLSSNIDVKMVFEPQYADLTVKKIFEELKEHSNVTNDFITLDESLDLIKPDTLLIITDTQSPKLAMFTQLIDKISRKSVIDHHRAGDDGYRDLLSYYVESSASSTVELVSEMFMFYNEGISLSSLEASIMLAGIIVDTNNFTFRSGVRTFEAASTLKSMGADMVYVRKLLREPMSVEQSLAHALMKAELIGDRFAIVCLDDNEIIEDRTTLAKISEKLLGIDGVDTSFTIGYITQDLVGVSARSLDSVNVQIIMEELGGGGHYNSAATQIKNASILDIKQQLIDIIKRDYLSEGDEKMKVILLQDVKGKGKKDQIIDVANGYGNYLLTNKLAVLANDENLLALEKQKEQERIDEEHRRDLLNKIKSEIQGKFISIYIKVGSDGKNFGHITTKLVCDEFEAQTGIHLDKRKVEIPADINSVGIFTATVKLDKDIIATFEINVIEK